MSLHSFFFKISSRDLKYLRPYSNLHTISAGLPIISWIDNQTVNDIISRFRDNLWLSYHHYPAKLLSMNELSVINNVLLEDYDNMDKDDQEYIDKIIEDIDRLCDDLEYEDRIAYVWFKY